jgi:hypothetical protein
MVAAKRLLHNVRRGSWEHYIVNYDHRFRDRHDDIIGYGTGDSEGCGYSESKYEIRCCWADDPGTRYAGIVGVKISDKKFWWLILVRHRK